MRLVHMLGLGAQWAEALIEEEEAQSVRFHSLSAILLFRPQTFAKILLFLFLRVNTVISSYCSCEFLSRNSTYFCVCIL
jgi:uncharacterized membrane protein